MKVHSVISRGFNYLIVVYFFFRCEDLNSNLSKVRRAQDI